MKAINSDNVQSQRLKEILHAVKVEATRAAFRAIAQYIEEQDAIGLLGGGTFRYLIYHRLHFGQKDYADLCHHGIWMLNLLYDREEKIPLLEDDSK